MSFPAAGNMYSFQQLPLQWAGDPRREECGLPLFEAEKIINPEKSPA
jgi:hypothetical protein